MIDQALARRRMVENQLRPSDVTDRALLAAMGEVPRERFVDTARQAVAYLDEPVPLPGGVRLMAAPTSFARLVQLAAIGPGDRVLHFGCATGYGTAVLARLAREVVAIEPDAVLAGRARETLDALGLSRIAVVPGGADAVARHGRFDAIVIEGAVEIVPDAMLDALEEGGRLVAVIRDAGRSVAHLFVRSGRDIAGRADFDVVMPSLPGFARPAAFRF